MIIFKIVDFPERRTPVRIFTKGVSVYAIILSTYCGLGIICITSVTVSIAHLLSKCNSFAIITAKLSILKHFCDYNRKTFPNFRHLPPKSVFWSNPKKPCDGFFQGVGGQRTSVPTNKEHRPPMPRGRRSGRTGEKSPPPFFAPRELRKHIWH